MSVEFLETLAADLLENDDLICFCVIFQDGSLYYCALNVRSADLHCAFSVNEKYFCKLHCFTFGLRKSLHKDLISSLYFKLLASNVYDCVHLK